MARFTLLALMLTAAATVSAQNEFIYEPSTTKPAFWTATARLIDAYSFDLYTGRGGSVTTESYLETRTIKGDVTPTATPTYTSTASLRYGDDVERVYMYYPTGAVAESDLVPDRWSTRSGGYTTTEYEFSMAVTMTAPSTCSSRFTITSVAAVDVPSAARSLVKPTSVNTGRSDTDRYSDVAVTETWYLSDGSAPFETSIDSNYRYYIQSCTTPPIAYRSASATATKTSWRGGDNSNSGISGYVQEQDDCYVIGYGCILPVMTIIIIVVSVVGGLFLLGFLESWLWFRRLMLGKSAMRFGTVCWILISLGVLCFTRMQDRRTSEDRELLAKKWKEMKGGAKFKAWMKYGFRHRYPEEHLGQFSRMTVGIVPPGQPLHPQMPTCFFPNGQAFYPGPQAGPGPYGQGIPPQGYTNASAQHAGFYGGELAKGGMVARAASAQPQPQPPPVNSTSQNVAHDTQPPSLPPRPLPTPPPNEVISEKPVQVLESAPPAPAESTQDAPQVPPIGVSEKLAPAPEVPEVSKAPEVPVAPEVSEAPEVPAAPEAPKAPEEPEASAAPKAPNNPLEPRLPKHDPDNKSLYE